MKEFGKNVGNVDTFECLHFIFDLDLVHYWSQGYPKQGPQSKSDPRPCKKWHAVVVKKIKINICQFQSYRHKLSIEAQT